MQSQSDTSQTIAKRDPALVMRLSRLGSFHQSRLSFMRGFDPPDDPRKLDLFPTCF